VESATSGGIDLIRDYLVVNADGAAQPIIINMRSDCAILNLSVRPAEHQSPVAEFVVMPDSSSGKPNVNTLSVNAGTGKGAPTLQPLTLSPGTYHVYALSSIDGLEYTNPQVMRNYPSKSVTLEAGHKTDLTVDLTERGQNEHAAQVDRRC
jgi:hypothetical protein